MKALAVLAAMVAVAGCDAPRVETAPALPPEPPAGVAKPPASHPTAESRRSAHDPSRVPADFLALWNEAVGRDSTSQHGDFFYHIAASGERAAAVLVPWNENASSPLLMGHRLRAVQEAFTVDILRAPRLAERHISTPYGPALAFDAFGYTYKVVTLRTQQRPPRNRSESLTLLVWRDALTTPARDR